MNFLTIKLMDGRKCDIKEIKAGDIFRANYNHSIDSPREFDITPFLFQQAIKIDGEQPTIEQVCELMIDDFIAINNVISTSMIKISSLQK